MLNNFDEELEKARDILKRIENRDKESNKEALRIAKILVEEADDPGNVYSVLHEMGLRFTNYNEINDVIDKKRMG